MTRFFWALGKTIFFGKDDTIERLRAWHQAQVAGLIQRWARPVDGTMVFIVVTLGFFVL